MSVSSHRAQPAAARGPRAWVNRIPLSVAILGVVTVAVVIVAELVILGR